VADGDAGATGAAAGAVTVLVGTASAVGAASVLAAGAMAARFCCCDWAAVATHNKAAMPNNAVWTMRMVKVWSSPQVDYRGTWPKAALPQLPVAP
jgi:hypothetical protein